MSRAVETIQQNPVAPAGCSCVSSLDWPTELNAGSNHCNRVMVSHAPPFQLTSRSRSVGYVLDGKLTGRTELHPPIDFSCMVSLLFELYVATPKLMPGVSSTKSRHQWQPRQK